MKIYTTKKMARGFTLVEMLVASTLLIFLATIAMGTLMTVMKVNKHSKATSLSMGELSSIFEKIFREASAGTTYHCGVNNNTGQERECPNNPRSWFAFEKQGGNPSTPNDQIVYRLNNKALEVSSDNQATFTRLTDPSIKVEHFDVYVIGKTSPAQSPEPAIYLSARGYVDEGNGAKTNFALQTMITQRPDFTKLRN